MAVEPNRPCMGGLEPNSGTRESPKPSMDQPILRHVWEVPECEPELMFFDLELHFLADHASNSGSAARPIWAQPRGWWRIWAGIGTASTTRTPATRSCGMAAMR